MTQEEQDAILGRTLRAYKEAKSKFGALKARDERHIRYSSRSSICAG